MTIPENFSFPAFPDPVGTLSGGGGGGGGEGW